MIIATTCEDRAAETRVAITPETARKLAALGATVRVEAGAGSASGFTDKDYEAAGAALAKTAREALADADVVLKVRRPSSGELALMKKGALVIAIMDPYGHEEALRAMASAGIDAFAMELMPRITRAQVMDVLSSQANLAGYRAVIDAAAEYGRALPMMMTAAGTVPAARIFIMGAGVAGLQAVATARRLGAVVTATDVRPAAKEQVESLGAKFVAVEDEEFKQAETAGGYAKEMSDAYKAKQAALDRLPYRQAGHRRDDRAHPGPAGAAPRLLRHGGEHEAGLGPHRPRGRARRQCRGREIRRDGGHRERRQDRGPCQCARTHRRELVGALRPKSLRLRRNAHRQGDEIARRQMGRRARQGDAPHQGWRGRASELRAQGRRTHGSCLMANLSPVEALERARAAADASREAADAAQAYAGQASEALGHVLAASTGGAVDPTVFRLAIFVLAIFVGYYVVWSVTPALHTPLMSVTNAISSVIVVGALLAVGVSLAAGEGASPFARIFGFVALTLASVNIFGGFLVTARMLAMYKKRAEDLS